MSYRKLKTASIYLFSILSIGAIARNPVIYGEDNRIEVFENKNLMYQRLASATAALIPAQKLRFEGRNTFILAPNIADDPKVNICPGERYAHQPKGSDCAGVLVAPDIIVTAGHCYLDPSNCGSKYWVFNYVVRNARQTRVAVRTRDVYSCKEIIEMRLTEVKKNSGIYNDFAIIRLDRPVKNVVPVKLSPIVPKVGTRALTIGTPSGLPLKIADGAIVKSANKHEFRATLDAFNFGSGSPVFNQDTGEYIGVISRGEDDFVQHPTRSCNLFNRISDSEPGEVISSTVQFARILKDL